MLAVSVDVGLFVVFCVSEIYVCVSFASRFEVFRDTIVHGMVVTFCYLSSWCLSVVF